MLHSFVVPHTVPCETSHSASLIPRGRAGRAWKQGYPSGIGYMSTANLYSMAKKIFWRDGMFPARILTFRKLNPGWITIFLSLCMCAGTYHTPP